MYARKGKILTILPFYVSIDILVCNLSQYFTFGLVQANAVALYLYFDYTVSQKAHKQAKQSQFDPGKTTLTASSCFKSAATVILCIPLEAY